MHLATAECGPGPRTEQLFIKAAHEDGDTARLVAANRMDSLELAFYTAILPHLASCERGHTGAAVLERMFPRFYAGSCSDGDFYLVLENLCARGLRLADCDQGLDRDQAATMITQVITIPMLGGTSHSILLFFQTCLVSSWPCSTVAL